MEPTSRDPKFKEQSQSSQLTAFRNLASWIENEYAKRKGRNQNYSLRAFANRAGLSSGQLSEIMKNRRRISLHTAKRISERLELSPENQENLFQIVTKDLQTQDDRRQFGGRAGIKEKRTLSQSEFQLIADPIHFAILAALESKNSTGTLASLAKITGRSIRSIRAALKNLTNLGLVAPKKKGKTNGWMRTDSGWIFSQSEKRDLAIQQSHRRKLMHATQAISRTNVTQRNYSSVTICIDPKKIPEAKKLMEEFRDKLGQFLTDGEQESVYELNLQLIPYNLSQTAQEDPNP